MTEGTLRPNPSANFRAARRVPLTQRWIILLVGIATSAFLTGSTASAQELEVTRKGENADSIEITNVDAKPVKISKITVNNRPDCALKTYAQIGRSFLRKSQGKDPDPAEEQFQESTLKVGDKIKYVGDCLIVRVTVETDQGFQTYHFTGSRPFD